MAKLLTYFDLCSISDHSEFLGLAEDNEPGTVINTLGRNIVLLVQLSNQQQVHSWNVLDKLSSKVVYDFRSKKYVGVFFNRYFRQWTAADADVNKVRKMKIPKLVHELVSVQRRDTLVLYKDGSCESLELCVDSRKVDRTSAPGTRAILDESQCRISQPQTFGLAAEGSDSVMLTYFVLNEGSVGLVYFRLDGETLQPSGAVQRLHIVRPDNSSAQLVGYVVVDGEQQPNLMTLWSDKRIFMLPLRFDDTAGQGDVPGFFVAMCSLFNVDQPLCVRAVGRDCVAIYGANGTQEGASLVLYNTRFNVAQSKQFFKVYFNNARIWVLGKYLLLAYGQTLACVSYRIARSQLADMIGSQVGGELTGVIDKDSINEEAGLEAALAFDEERQQWFNEQQLPVSNGVTVTETEKVTTNGKSGATAALPAEAVDDVRRDLRHLYAHDLLVDVHRGEVFLSDTVQVQIGSSVRDATFAADEILLLAAEMERAGASECEITERVVPLLVAAGLADELVRCLRRYANVSERQLVRVLKYFLNADASGKQTKTAENGTNGAGAVAESTARRQELTIDAGKAKYVNVALSCSFAREQLGQYLRSELDFSEVLALLDHITALLQSGSDNLEEMVQFGEAFNEDLQLLAWFETIVDAHYQQFVLSRNRRLLETMQRWSEYIRGQMDAVRGLKSLSAELYRLVQGKALAADQQSSKWYSVEMVKLY